MRNLYLLIFILFTSQSILAQESFNIIGLIRDKKGETLPGAGVFVSGYKIATVSNNNGEYSL